MQYAYGKLSMVIISKNTNEFIMSDKSIISPQVNMHESIIRKTTLIYVCKMKFKTIIIILVTSDNMDYYYSLVIIFVVCFKKQLYNGCSKILLIITTGNDIMNFILHKLLFFEKYSL